MLIVVALLALGVVVLWVATPSGDDLTGRVQVMAISEHATVLAPGEVPPLLAEAVVATEDERFYQHHGIDVIGLGRAFLYDVTHLCACQGGSTITQQLVKDVYLGGSDGGVNKLADMTLAFKVELRFNKQQILADYLSVVPTGFARYGMANAACADFHRPLAHLDLGQLALLAGMPQAPSRTTRCSTRTWPVPGAPPCSTRWWTKGTSRSSGRTRGHGGGDAATRPRGMLNPSQSSASALRQQWCTVGAVAGPAALISRATAAGGKSIPQRPPDAQAANGREEHEEQHASQRARHAGADGEPRHAEGGDGTHEQLPAIADEEVIPEAEEGAHVAHLRAAGALPSGAQGAGQAFADRVTPRSARSA